MLHLIENPSGISTRQKPNSSKRLVVHKKAFINFSISLFFLVCRWTDCSQNPRGDRPYSALSSHFNHQSTVQRRQPDGVMSAQCSSACAVVSVCASWKEAGLTMPEAEDPAPQSELGNISPALFFTRRCPSVWCQLSLGQQHETQPLIYHIQDLSVSLMSQDILQRRDKGHSFAGEAVALLN